MLLRAVLSLLVLFVQLFLPLAPVFADEIVPEVSPQEESVVESSGDIAPPISEELAPDVVYVPSDELASNPNIENANLFEEVTSQIDQDLSEFGAHVSVGATSDSTDTSINTEIGVPTNDSIALSQGIREIEEPGPEVSTTTIESEEIISETVATVTPEIEVSTILDNDVVSTTTDVENVTSTIGDSTTTLTIVQPEVNTLTNDENRYSFGVNECARVADGSFYCNSSEASDTVTETDRVFTAADQDGDEEIFFEREGELIQFTYNQVDDGAPYYDASSESFVWHRLVDARYQIVVFNLETGREEQITHDSYNNMQPSRYGNLIVWQGWVGNDWEIFMDTDGEIRMLTDNTTHDIGPRINGEYIIWQSEEPEGWKVKVYNTSTKVVETIADTEGASVENPRLVLVYDAKHENGDIETRGYDLVTKKSVPLSSEAPVLPEEIPDPDQTGDRALIAGVTQLKVKTDEDDGEPDSLPLEPTFNGGTTTDDLVIPSFKEATTTGYVGDIIDTVSTSSIPDLVIDARPTPLVEIEIPDLIVPVYGETERVSTSDSQTAVAETR